MFTGSFNVLSFSVTPKNITHVRTEEMCLAHYQAAINQYHLSKKQFAEKYIEKALQEISKLPSGDVQNYKNEKIEYFRKDANLEELFIDYDNILEERRALAKSELLTKEIEALKNEIESKMSNGLSQKEVGFYRAKLFKLSSAGNGSIISDDIQNVIIHLQKLINSSTMKSKVNNASDSYKPKKKNDAGNTESYDKILSLTMSFYELEPTDSISIIKHLTALFYLSLSDNAIKANIGDKWKDKLIALLSSSELRKLFKYNILKDKQEGASRVFIAIDEKLYAFYNIRLGNKLVKQLLPDKIFLNKDDYHDPLKNIEELLFSL